MNNSEFIMLSIETSCDETAAAITRNGRDMLANVVATQIDVHRKFGGVVPEIASRKHLEGIMPVIDEAVKIWGGDLHRIDGIAVTYGPGLVGALLVGISAAKALAFALKKPLIAVNHIEGHIAANYITHPELKPPFVCLVASGGHSHLISVKDYICFEILGRTRDDAAGEAYDKIARVLGLGYPGGPEVDKRAVEYMGKGSFRHLDKSVGEFAGEVIVEPELPKFPRVRFTDGTLDFSFSGVKTAVMNYINKERMQGREIDVDSVCAGFQEAVTDVLVDNTQKAARQLDLNKAAVVGGVAANIGLRKKMGAMCEKEGFKLFIPDFSLCTDNAAMIGAAGYYSYISGRMPADLDLNAVPNLKL